MKQNIDIEKKAFGPNGQNLKEAEAGFEKNHALVLLLFTDCCTSATISPALLMDRGSRQLGRDGPPGRARSPGSARGDPPAIVGEAGPPEEEIRNPDSPDSNRDVRMNEHQPARQQAVTIENNEYQNFNTNQNSNYYKHFKFFIMKKQILFLMVFLMAGLAGISTAFGQLTSAVTCPVPRVIEPTCLPSDALHPIPGQPYNYEVTVPTPPGVKSYTWFVTQDPKFVVTGSLTSAREVVLTGLHIAASGAGYNDVGNGTATLSLTWKSFVPDPLLPVFVVISVDNQAPLAGCLSNNMKVFKIMPVNAFTLDIANVGPAGGAPAAFEIPIDRCISNIVSATYDATAPEGVIYDFGVDYLYYLVTAANFSTSWLPSLQVSAIDAKETVTAVQWFRSSDIAFATPVAMPLAAGTYTSASPVTVLDASGTVGSVGECIIIRVTVDHSDAANNYQGLTDETITVAVDGKTQLALTTPLGDIHFSSTVGTAADCGKEDAFRNDVATQILKARPDITAPTMPTPGLLPVKP